MRLLYVPANHFAAIGQKSAALFISRVSSAALVWGAIVSLLFSPLLQSGSNRNSDDRAGTADAFEQRCDAIPVFISLASNVQFRIASEDLADKDGRNLRWSLAVGACPANLQIVETAGRWYLRRIRHCQWSASSTLHDLGIRLQI